MRVVSIFWVLAALFNSLNVCAQDLPASEKCVYSFEGEKNQKVRLTHDTLKNYMVLRMFTGNNLTLDIKDNLSDTVRIFRYHFFARGGGEKNEGVDLNYIDFTKDGMYYILFDEFITKNNTFFTGLRIKNHETKQQSEIIGIPTSRKGSLISLRDNGLLPMEK